MLILTVASRDVVDPNCILQATPICFVFFSELEERLNKVRAEVELQANDNGDFGVR